MAAKRQRKKVAHQQVWTTERYVYRSPFSEAGTWYVRRREIATGDVQRIRLAAETRNDALRAIEAMVQEQYTAEDQGTPEAPALSVAQIADRYLAYEDNRYREPRRHVQNVGSILKSLAAFCGHVPAKKFGPRLLKSWRSHLVKARLARKYINGCVHKVRACFRWAVSEELLPADVHTALRTVAALEKGEEGARETAPVQSVNEEHVNAVEPHVSMEVWAMIRLQLATGMRSGEVCIMRPRDIDRKDAAAWAYTPGRHKTAHHGHRRVIFLGPRAQAVLAPFLKRRSPWRYIFSPAEAEEVRRVREEAARKTPASCGNVRGSNRVDSPSKEPGPHYTPTTYARAIARACEKAGVPHWTPHQLRHAVATRVEEQYTAVNMDGKMYAAAVLGHRDTRTTDGYIDDTAAHKRAREVARAIG